MRRHKEIAYGILRFMIGLVFFFYGIGKLLRGIDQVRSGMVERFAESPLPQALVGAFATILPFIEIVVGALLIVGFLTQSALVATGLLVAALTFGTVMEPNPESVASNVNYALVIFVLLWLSELDYYSVDGLRRRGSAK